MMNAPKGVKMKINQLIRRAEQRKARLLHWLCLTILAMLPGYMICQQQPNKLTYFRDPANVPDAIAKVKSGQFDGIHVQMIANAHAVEAIPALEKQFPLQKDQDTKAIIASALVRLGDSNDMYWHYLVNLAIPVIALNIPDPFMYDAQGKVTGGTPPELVAWAKRHNMTLSQAAGQAFVGVYEGLGNLAITGDPRGVPLLRRALQSHNYIEVTLAAKGLAQAQDYDSIPLIIEACKHAPRDPAIVIAESLVYFDDDEAQRAFDEFVPPDAAKAYREGRTNGTKTGPFQ